MTLKANSMRIAAVADLHRDRSDAVSFRDIFSAAEQAADVLLICGDLTDYGLPDEAKRLAAELVHIKIPIIAVLGNHDYEAGQTVEITKILTDVGVHLLDGQACEIEGVGFAGVKGFCGGFGVRTLEPWGERIIKQFVQEALDESLKLELALSRLRTECRVALLHYAPILGTVQGEPEQIYCFLGSSRLEEPLNRYHVTAVFHGHAHHGAAEGKTRDGIPVYNVSLPLLRQMAGPDRPALRIVELPITCAAPVAESGTQPLPQAACEYGAL
jgi:Icc-related predicted phosphoesterase